ncbi:hypothetical protein DPEC_G00161510 [Dallia pectoralis]|uniref:Uncharacterized protein n=1 Tax=Dallia pectoralis TaxID=75939 RepID=A0ACC2GG84_DALPE|nr:hypothetical protein DPEC_G00161510 [Dallia pectoralis]
MNGCPITIVSLLSRHRFSTWLLTCPRIDVVTESRISGRPVFRVRLPPEAVCWMKRFPRVNSCVFSDVNTRPVSTLLKSREACDRVVAGGGPVRSAGSSKIEGRRSALRRYCRPAVQAIGQLGPILACHASGTRLPLSHPEPLCPSGSPPTHRGVQSVGHPPGPVQIQGRSET